MKKADDRLLRMISSSMGRSGTIRFKYYGEFDTMKRIHNDCKDELMYVGNSRIDGSPVFIYQYDSFKHEEIQNFDIINNRIRIAKIKHYSGKELTKKERSVMTFFKFFMIAYNNLEIKGLSMGEINEVSFNTD